MNQASNHFTWSSTKFSKLVIRQKAPNQGHVPFFSVKKENITLPPPSTEKPLRRPFKFASKNGDRSFQPACTPPHASGCRHLGRRVHCMDGVCSNGGDVSGRHDGRWNEGWKDPPPEINHHHHHHRLPPSSSVARFLIRT